MKRIVIRRHSLRRPAPKLAAVMLAVQLHSTTNVAAASLQPSSLAFAFSSSSRIRSATVKRRRRAQHRTGSGVTVTPPADDHPSFNLVASRRRRITRKAKASEPRLKGSRRHVGR